jgi:ABC-2 type transport system permease protein
VTLAPCIPNKTSLYSTLCSTYMFMNTSSEILTRRNRPPELVVDLIQSWKMREGWITLAKFDLHNSYRRTTFGPFWITIQQSIWILSINLVFTKLLGMPTSDFLPIVAIGIVVWSLIQNLISSSATIYTSSSSQIKSSTIPLPFYIFQSIFSTVLSFLHTLLALLFLPLVAQVSLNPIALLTSPFVITAMLLNGLFMSLWMAPLAARYRDVSTTIPVILQILLFLTPVFWSAEIITDREIVVLLNPLAWFIQTFRAPFLGEKVHALAIIGILLLTVANALVAMFVYPRTKRKVNLWI